MIISICFCMFFALNALMVLSMYKENISTGVKALKSLFSKTLKVEEKAKFHRQRMARKGIKSAATTTPRRETSSSLSFVHPQAPQWSEGTKSIFTISEILQELMTIMFHVIGKKTNKSEPKTSKKHNIVIGQEQYPKGLFDQPLFSKKEPEGLNTLDAPSE